MKHNMKHILVGFTSLLLLGVVASAQGAWWEFGRQDNEPAITDLKLNAVDAVWAEDQVTLSRDDLEQGEIIVRGRADIRQGVIGLVEVSLDGGETWVKATLGDRGLFTYEFRPDMDRSYEFRVRAFTTTGVSTDVEDHSFRLTVSTMSNTEEVRRVFMGILQAYMDENRVDFMRYVSQDFEGDLTALEDAVSDDFRWLDQIRIQPYISRIVSFDQEYQVYFTFNRQVISVADGKVLRDNAATTATFRREEGSFRLSRLAAPLIFGISNPSEVATSVTSDSVGQNVITVNKDTGTASTEQQGQTVGESTVEDGTVTLNVTDYGNNYQSFAFADGGERFDETDFNFFEGDIAFSGWELRVRNGVGWQQIAGPLSATTSVPSSGYSTVPYISSGGTPQGIAAGSTFALQLFGSNTTYAVIEVVSMNPDTSLTFRYKYQPNGSTSF